MLALHLLLTSSLAFSPAAATQAPEARILLESGQTLGVEGTVTRIWGLDLGSGRRWAAGVDLERPEGGGAAALVLDGHVLIVSGGVAAGGERVAAVAGIQLGLDDGPLLQYLVPAPPGEVGFRGRLSIGRTVLLRDGQLLDLQGRPNVSRLERILSFDAQGSWLLVTAVVRTGNAEAREAALRFHVEDGVIDQTELLAEHGSNAGALQHTIDEFLPAMDVAEDGGTALSFRVLQGVENATAGLHDLAPRFESGTLAPQGVGAWECVNPRVACASGGRLVIGGSVMAGDFLGIVANTSEVLALEGSPHPAVPSEVVGPFIETEVGVTESGEAAFTVPLASGGELLTLGDQVLLRASVSAVESRVVRRICWQEHGSLAVAPHGDRLLVKLELEPGVEAVVELEPNLGQPGPCGAAPNSTGQAGVLFGTGSGFVEFNAVRLRGAQLPPDAFGLILASRTPSYLPNPGGSAGALCLGGSIGRLLPGVQADASGALMADVDLGSIVQPTGTVGIQPGEAWHFQLWYRDVASSGSVTSNFSTSLRIDFD